MIRIGVVADVHVAPPGTPPVAWHGPLAFSEAEARLRAATKLLTGAGAGRIAALGDLSHLGDRGSLAMALEALGAARVPVVAVSGNHDAMDHASALEEAVADSRLATVSVGTPAGVPLASGARLAGVHVSADAAGAVSHLVAPPDVGPAGAGLLVLASHFPLVSRASRLAAAGVRDAGDLASGREEAELRVLARRAPSLVLCGHLHVREVSAHGPVLQACVPALVEDPAEVALVTIEGRQVRIEYLPVAGARESAAALGPKLSEWAYADERGCWEEIVPVPGP